MAQLLATEPNHRRLHRVQVDIDSLVAPVDYRIVERIARVGVRWSSVADLVANALHHITAHAPVWVRLRRVPQGALLTVDNNGPGVSA